MGHDKGFEDRAYVPSGHPPQCSGRSNSGSNRTGVAACAVSICLLVAAVCALPPSRAVELVEKGRGTKSTMSSIENQLQGAQQMFDEAQVQAESAGSSVNV